MGDFMKSKEVRLYNLIFPVFMIMLLSPAVWLILIAANFFIDSLVLWIGCRIAGVSDFKSVWKKSILRIVFFGFLADMLGSLALTLMYYGMMFLQWNIPLNSYFWPGCLFTCLPMIVFSGWLVYLFNRKLTLKKAGLHKRQIRTIALSLALLTAPYFAAVPYNIWTAIFTG